MNLIKPGANFNFVGNIRLAVTVSLILIAISILSIVLQRGLNLGIDFAGGNLIQIQFQTPATIDRVRASLVPLNLENSVIQTMGADEVVIRIAGDTDIKNLSTQISSTMDTFFGKGAYEIRRVEYVGPRVGQDLRNKALMAIILSWIGMLVYITIRFELRHALGGILALIHDVILTVGVLSVLGKEFNLPIVAALLTVIGYSINDTIVIFDRMRETARKDISRDIKEVINVSINETLNRTLLTSLTTLLVVVILSIFGGPVIRDFAITLIAGIIVGTYSSIFIASPIVLYFNPQRSISRTKT